MIDVIAMLLTKLDGKQLRLVLAYVSALLPED